MRTEADILRAVLIRETCTCGDHLPYGELTDEQMAEPERHSSGCWAMESLEEVARKVEREGSPQGPTAAEYERLRNAAEKVAARLEGLRLACLRPCDALISALVGALRAGLRRDLGSGP